MSDYPPGDEPTPEEVTRRLELLDPWIEEVSWGTFGGESNSDKCFFCGASRRIGSEGKHRFACAWVDAVWWCKQNPEPEG